MNESLGGVNSDKADDENYYYSNYLFVFYN
jgi:hypothetical protein